MTNEEKLARVCLRIRAASPESWEELLAHLKECVSGLKDKMVMAPPEHIIGARGMVLGALEIVSKLENARELVERVDRNKKNG